MKKSLAKSAVREYAVMASGHGFCFTFGNCSPPKKEWKTKTEAEKEVAEWESISDTIGGQGKVVHMPTYLSDIALGQEEKYRY